MERGGIYMIIKNPTTARAEFYDILKEVNNSHQPVVIHGKNSENNAVIIGQKDWESIQETLFLESTGTLEVVREREKDDSGFTNIDDLDWENL